MAGRLSRNRLVQQLEIQSMVWPGLLFLLVFAYVPMYGVRIAFEDYNIITGFEGAKWVGLKYFEQFLMDPNLLNVLRNTFVLNILGLVIGFPAPILLAILITELRNVAFKRAAQTASYLPHFLSWVIYGGILLEVISPTGVLNAALQSVGIIEEPINFIGVGQYFYGIFTIASVLKSMGFSSILLRPPPPTKWRGYWKRKPLLHRSRLIRHEPEHEKSGHAGERGRWNISDNFIFFGVLMQCLYWQLYPVTALQ